MTVRDEREHCVQERNRNSSRKVDAQGVFVRLSDDFAIREAPSAGCPHSGLSDGRRVASGAQCCAKRVMPTGICVECGNEKDKIHFGTNEWKRKATGVLGSRVR